MATAGRLQDKVAVITGGARGIGANFCEALAGAGAKIVIADVLDGTALAERLAGAGGAAAYVKTDVSSATDVGALRDVTLDRFGTVDILVNNAANNPKVEEAAGAAWSRLEHFPLDVWEADLAVGLTGAFLCSQAIGSEMARRGKGVILNVASDLAIIAPDQRLYRQDGVPDAQQPVKPVTYSVVKTALVGLTRYLATYWADAGVRVNAISPGGVYNGQSEEFVTRLSALIPLSRMADVDEYKGAILFLCSDASSYMTGANLVIDGGRSSW